MASPGGFSSPKARGNGLGDNSGLRDGRDRNQKFRTHARIPPRQLQRRINTVLTGPAPKKTDQKNGSLNRPTTERRSSKVELA